MDPLRDSIQYVKGVGPRLAERFATRGIRTVGDALFFLPRRYEDRRRVQCIRQLRAGDLACFTAQVLDFGVRRTGPRSRILDLLLGDDSGRIQARWFRFHPGFAERFERGQQVRVAGKVDLYRGVRQLVHPDVQIVDPDGAGEEGAFGGIVPVYPEIEGIYPRTLRKIMTRVVAEYAGRAPDVLPGRLLGEMGLPGLSDALRQAHFPDPGSDLDELNRMRSPGQRRLIFEELFLLQVALGMQRARYRAARAVQCEAPVDLLELSRELFDFELTQAQRRVLAELVEDLASEQPMNRLLQGDVGSGKTALAVLAAVSASRSGVQTAFMAPTEVLAEQHHRNIQAMLARSRSPVGLALLTSAVQGEDRRRALEEVASGKVCLVVGTQALIEEKVCFARLGLCIIDEQHRFGVMQRARLRTKGTRPHVLVMTATPIPRTLSMTLYGDLDVSVLDELPPGRQHVRTELLRTGQTKRAYDHVRREVAAGGQAYLIYPLVEESEKLPMRDASSMFENLQAGPLSGLRLGLLHGRMSPEQKVCVMEDFVAGRIEVLISTTVVEVGVDVPRASVIVIEHAERFGLSQLHQLRGRVGRGGRLGTCYLVAHNLPTEDARARLKVMQRTNDGFAIAEEDLAIRGPGEYLGTRQSGAPVFAFADLLRDSELLSEARRAAIELLHRDPSLGETAHRPLLDALQARWSRRLMLAEVG
ncbi:MAG: ATP-dependent DNA helicase RecG [Deltaproteobacteria bacterium]|nr:ATP-dependent DNA helicase RecG [Deltaproteobacteria bacterium]